ncbi:MAG: hypothetical protein WCY67_03210 [Acidithiobacillus sp.]
MRSKETLARLFIIGGLFIFLCGTSYYLYELIHWHGEMCINKKLASISGIAFGLIFVFIGAFIKPSRKNNQTVTPRALLFALCICYIFMVSAMELGLKINLYAIVVGYAATAYIFGVEFRNRKKNKHAR